MATNNAINLKAAGVVTYDGAGLFTASTFSQYTTLVGGANNSIASVGPGTVAFPLVSGGAGVNPSYAALTVPGGGTGVVSFTAYALLAGGTSSTGALQQVSGLGNAGEVLTSAGAGALPVWAAAPLSDLPWSVVTAATQAMSNDNGYISNAAAGGVTYTLPATAAVGTILRVTGLSGGSGWVIEQNAGQSIEIGSSVTTTGTGGSLASTSDNDSVHLVCAVADDVWICISAMGNITVV